MAHFAKIGLNNEVIEVLCVDNVNTMTPQGIEEEWIGVGYLRNLTGHHAWVQTSYNGNFRGRFAGVGDRYDQNLDEFISPWIEEDSQTTSGNLEHSNEPS